MSDDKTSRLFQWIALGFIVAGIGLLIFGWWEYRQTARFLGDAVSTTGTVTSNERTTNSKGEAAYYPVVRFTPAHGDPLEFRSRTGSSSGLYPIGTEVAVLYSPSNPKAAEIQSFTAQWLGTIILTVLGVGFTAMGTAAWLVFSPLRPTLVRRSQPRIVTGRRQKGRRMAKKA